MPDTLTQPDEQIVREIIHVAGMAVDYEILNCTTPVSAVRNPDGSQQLETPHEHSNRIIITAIRYCLELGLLAVPDDIEEAMKGKHATVPVGFMDAERTIPVPGLPLQRATRDGIPGIRQEDGTYTA